jgi:hypothetical protein
MLQVAVALQDLQIHGNEPCPLFDEKDPFWEQYQRDPDFVPRPGDYLKLRSDAVLLLDWRFIKSSWVRRSQVCDLAQQRTSAAARQQCYGSVNSSAGAVFGAHSKWHAIHKWHARSLESLCRLYWALLYL